MARAYLQEWLEVDGGKVAHGGYTVYLTRSAYDAHMQQFAEERTDSIFAPGGEKVASVELFRTLKEIPVSEDFYVKLSCAPCRYIGLDPGTNIESLASYEAGNPSP